MIYTCFCHLHSTILRSPHPRYSGSGQQFRSGQPRLSMTTLPFHQDSSRDSFMLKEAAPMGPLWPRRYTTTNDLKFAVIPPHATSEPLFLAMTIDLLSLPVGLYVLWHIAPPSSYSNLNIGELLLLAVLRAIICYFPMVVLLSVAGDDSTSIPIATSGSLALRPGEIQATMARWNMMWRFATAPLTSTMYRLLIHDGHSWIPRSAYALSSAVVGHVALLLVFLCVVGALGVRKGERRSGD